MAVRGKLAWRTDDGHSFFLKKLIAANDRRSGCRERVLETGQVDEQALRIRQGEMCAP